MPSTVLAVFKFWIFTLLTPKVNLVYCLHFTEANSPRLSRFTQLTSSRSRLKLRRPLTDVSNLHAVLTLGHVLYTKKHLGQQSLAYTLLSLLTFRNLLLHPELNLHNNKKRTAKPFCIIRPAFQPFQTWRCLSLCLKGFLSYPSSLSNWEQEQIQLAWIGHGHQTTGQGM